MAHQRSCYGRKEALPSSLACLGCTGTAIPLPQREECLKREHRVCVGIFTSVPSAIQICLNNEPILSLQPDASSAVSLSALTRAALNSTGGGANMAQAVLDDKYVLCHTSTFSQSYAVVDMF